MDILLAYAGEFAVELVGVCGLADVKLGLPLGSSSAHITASASLSVVAVEVIEEAEERSERGLRGLAESAREESHCVYNELVLNLMNGVKLTNYVLCRLLDGVEICWKALLGLVVV